MHSEENKPVGGTAVTGAVLGGVGTLLGVANNGGLAGLLGGNRPPAGDPPWARDMGYERQLTEKDSEIGQLKAQLYCDQAVNGLRQEMIAGLARLDAKIDAGAAAQTVANTQTAGAISVLKASVSNMEGIFTPIIRGSVMQASEAVAASMHAPAASTTTNAG